MHVHVNIDKHIKKKQKQTSGLTKWRWNLIYQRFETQSTSYILQLISNQINCPLINKKIKLTGMVDRVCPKIPFLYHFTRILINRTKFLIINNILIEDINTFSHQFKQFTLIYVTFLKLISWYEMSALLFPRKVISYPFFPQRSVVSIESLLSFLPYIGLTGLRS